jgi:hypothetical protein
VNEVLMSTDVDGVAISNVVLTFMSYVMATVG